jgi:hypothetical protein
MPNCIFNQLHKLGWRAQRAIGSCTFTKFLPSLDRRQDGVGNGSGACTPVDLEHRVAELDETSYRGDNDGTLEREQLRYDPRTLAQTFAAQLDGNIDIRHQPLKRQIIG